MPNEFYSTSCKGIGGQIKRRYTDFVVEEILPDGRVCSAKRFLEQGTHEFEPLEIPENRGEEQLHLHMEKINRDVNFCIRGIARFLQCSNRRIGYAGMKDKRAVTCQRVSIFKPNLERLQEFSSQGIQLRNAEWSNERIELGMLKGNSFTIIVRDISLNEKELGKRIGECFKEMESGIANYFGEQRFGGIRGITHIVGREFIRGNMKQGVMLYLTHSDEREEEEIRQARERLAETNNFSEASRLFPVKFRYERAIIHHLCKYPNDFVGAFGKLPKQLRYLFTHAYQSYLFNRVIDERLRQGIGLKRVKGDILIENRPTAPLFGFESALAKGKAGEIEEKVLQEEGLQLQQFKVKQMPELSSKGARKSILLVPENMRLLNVSKDEFYEGMLAATVSFSLEKGNYATTVLRELMKSEAR
ncbi:MAG: tRNA pseudouridine(13) synthase TruD [Candidatus Diapherotrites archaeon]|uniref:Probable tRNA pseudouridine synthase D n=1 Tax=Candidatus Iainarchaeum sp. TaxID=3101447 RepID=A0A938YS43_9ARCH|nr:tRNA pseudouridine(13) synthase TruD [Candidatus Diapherotrites archaeon]